MSRLGERAVVRRYSYRTNSIYSKLYTNVTDNNNEAYLSLQGTVVSLCNGEQWTFSDIEYGSETTDTQRTENKDKRRGFYSPAFTIVS